MIASVALGALGLGAFFIARTFLRPAADDVQRREPVLTGEYEPRLQSCRVLEDHELPAEIAPPAVGESFLYLEVVVLHPGSRLDVDPKTYVLVRVNGNPEAVLTPVHGAADTPAEGTLVHVVYRIEANFEYASLAAGDRPIIKKVVLE
ncbi:MAG: hypothetical protein ACREID_08125 [Planctomycetota bacterium]